MLIKHSQPSATQRHRGRRLQALGVAVLVFASQAVASSSAEAAASTTAVWIGSPLASSTWPNSDGCPATYPSAGCSLPSAHHTYKYGDAYVGDIGFDLQSVAASATVKLYAAPNNTAYNSQIKARVKKVTLACSARSGETTSQTAARGGYAVVVEILHGTNPIGTVKFVHINPSVKQGQSIDRWGSKIGTVGTYTNNSCWRGRHLHMEMTNEKNYACYNRTWKPGQQVKETNFLGFIGGAYATSGRKPCP